ncbi:hypothetical protein KM043_014790 [Ampulex compressa]|nr:hypothetical protein KM043_014790 [Ampulex compressa]
MLNEPVSTGRRALVSVAGGRSSYSNVVTSLPCTKISTEVTRNTNNVITTDRRTVILRRGTNIDHDNPVARPKVPFDHIFASPRFGIRAVKKGGTQGHARNAGDSNLDAGTAPRALPGVSSKGAIDFLWILPGKIRDFVDERRRSRSTLIRDSRCPIASFGAGVKGDSRDFSVTVYFPDLFETFKATSVSKSFVKIPLTKFGS